jgi:hypothetical protein
MAMRYRQCLCFSKKVANHSRALALHFMHYDWGRIHKPLRVTPAMQAGIAYQVWIQEEVARLAIDGVGFILDLRTRTVHFSSTHSSRSADHAWVESRLRTRRRWSQ